MLLLMPVQKHGIMLISAQAEFKDFVQNSLARLVQVVCKADVKSFCQDSGGACLPMLTATLDAL